MIRKIPALLFCLSLLGCAKTPAPDVVSFYGWGGDYSVNRWIDTILAPALKEQSGITLNRVPMNVDEILNKLAAEKNANAPGNIDLVWINGENFFAAKKAGLLYGPLTGMVPNFEKYIGADDIDAAKDFGHDTEGYEIPYGKAQLVFIADGDKLKTFPVDAQSLLALAKANPGKITYPAPPDFVGSAFVRNIITDIVGYDALFAADPSIDNLARAASPALEYFNELKPYLWQQGTTYPKTNAALDQMFTDGQVLFTMNYTPLYAVQKVLAGEFPSSSRTFVFDKGNVGNTHYVAIPFNAPHKDAALKLINLILSPHMQISKFDAKNWGDLPVLNISLLSPEDRALLLETNSFYSAVPIDELMQKRIPEIQAEKVTLIEKLWETEVLKK